ncbi:MAG TPA: EamA family transporter [Bryobacteraceae bacterium]|jgi:drug/metabolite transporter (DMT)-like permease|nr:EamA family transporter [Bryobacteraceae bacterium]
MSRQSSFSAYIALGAVCFFWGTTYLGIRISIETLPPAFVVCARFLLSGSLLLAVALMRGSPLPRGRELRVACLCGILILGIGNAAAVYAEQIIPSGLASLFVTISPFWMVGFEALMGGESLHAPTIAGMAIGFGGTAMLLLPGASAHVDHSMVIGFLIVETGVVGWTLGSLYQRRQPAKSHPIVTGAVQQLAAGLFYVPIALFVPEAPVVFSERSVLALLYLVVFGSIVGYSAFIFAMDRLPVSIVSIYPYFNAVVAMGLGWLFFREPFGLREWIAMLIIFSGVAMVRWQSRKRKL